MSDAHAYKQIHEIHIKIHEMAVNTRNTSSPKEHIKTLNIRTKGA